MLEIWRSGFQGVPSADGQQFAELNATQPSTLYQDVPTVPGTVMTWSIWHRGRAGTDVMRVLIGAPGATVARLRTGRARRTSPPATPPGVSTRAPTRSRPGRPPRFSFQAVSSAGGGASDNFLDGVVFQTPPCKPMK